MGDKLPGPSQTGVQGESISPSHSALKLSPLTSVCSALGDHIQQTLRDKIACHEFFDLGLCLENWELEEAPRGPLRVNGPAGLPSVEIPREANN